MQLAREAIRKAEWLAELVDESHFGLSLRRCGCGQHFLSMFCERVDWADGDDPQTWLAVPVSESEAGRLREPGAVVVESAILRILPGERRFLFMDAPKGKPEVVSWRKGPLFIPAHD